jgi:hypothetical protein
MISESPRRAALPARRLEEEPKETIRDIDADILALAVDELVERRLIDARHFRDSVNAETARPSRVPQVLGKGPCRVYRLAFLFPVFHSHTQ